MRNKSLMRLAVCLIGMAAMVLQGCSEGGTDRDKLCGSWSSVEGKPDVLVYKEGEAYKVTVFARSGKMRRYRNLVSYYTNKNIAVSYLRARKKNDLDRVMRLYGNETSKYW